MDACSRTRISYATLILIMLLNALLFITCIYYFKETTRATFYGLNVLTVLLLFGTLLIQSYGYTGRPDEKRRSTPYLYCIIGVMAGTTLLISAVMGFSQTPSINDFIILLSCIAILAVYVYIIMLRDHL
jgi:peptidoglycan/LPS O-acetylase OafA/YrhL